jgi:ppGpp synthetase/RelA/SpoT-type nucleotidyltranferase
MRRAWRSTRTSSALQELADPYLVRARVEDPRIKSLASLKRKARSRKWTLADAIERATDLVGHRVVCNNLQDVRRIADLLQQGLAASGIDVTRKDFVSKPTRQGYRGIHLEIRLPMRIAAEQLEVGCEIQLRSLLQDAWGRLSRDDIYTRELQIPRELQEKMTVLSERLAELDSLADEIRKEIARPREGTKPEPGSPPTGSALAFLYRSAFGADPPDYVVEAALRDLDGLQVRSDGLDGTLQDKSLRQRLASAYRKEFSWKPDSAQMFRWLIAAHVDGADAAEKLARAEGHDEAVEVERIWRSESLSDLPESWRDLVDQLRSPEKDDDPEYRLRTWAEALGATSSCFCGETIIDSWGFADAVVEHYGLEGDEADTAGEAVREAIWQYGGMDDCPVHGGS